MRAHMLRSMVVFVMFVALAGGVMAQAQDTPLPRLITVNGISDVWVEPDEAVLSIGVTSQGKALDQTQKEQDQQVKKVIRLLTRAGIAEKDIQTSRLQIGAEYEYIKEARTMIGYKASQSFTVVLRDLSKHDALLTDLIKNGVDDVFGIEFRLSNTREHADKARIQAARAAKEKAVAIATELGAKVGRPHTIQEMDEEPWQPAMRANVMMAEAKAGQAGFASGQIRVRARVTVSFELE